MKRREARLKREQDGLRSLVSGLVGGPALLREWEREWAQRFGGAERDEVENDGSATDDEGDDGESEDGGDEEEAGRAMNYRILGHQVEVQGLCPPCQALSEHDNDSRRDASNPRGRRTNAVEETTDP